MSKITIGNGEDRQTVDMIVVPKGPLVSDIKEGDQIEGVYLVESVQVKKKKNNEPYFAMTLKDRTGQIGAKKWDGGDQPKVGSFVKVRGDVSSWSDKLDINVKLMRELTLQETVAVEDFVPIGPRDRYNEMVCLAIDIAAIRHPGLRALCQFVVDDPALHMAFRDAPAATNNHHAYVGGLLDHVRSMISVAHRMGAHYTSLNVDLLITACIFHDIGKTRELEWSRSLEYTREGRLVGHVAIGGEILDRLKPIFLAALQPLGEIKEYDDALRLWDHLRHLIASHHGNLEWGAAKKPMSREAVAFHLIDMMDSRMAAFDTYAGEPVNDDGFTGWIRPMEGPIWKS